MPALRWNDLHESTENEKRPARANHAFARFAAIPAGSRDVRTCSIRRFALLAVAAGAVLGGWIAVAPTDSPAGGAEAGPAAAVEPTPADNAGRLNGTAKPTSGSGENKPQSASDDERYLGPVAVAAAPNGPSVFVANADGRNVIELDRNSGKPVRTIDLVEPPSGLAVAPDGSLLLITCAAPQSELVFVDVRQGRIVDRLPLGYGACAPVISPDGSTAYVCCRFDNQVAVVDLEARKLAATINVAREPIVAALAGPNREVLLVGNHLPKGRIEPLFRGDLASVVSVIDRRSLRVEEIRLPHGSNGVRGLAVTPDGRHAFVAHLLSNFEMTPIRVDGGWINTNVVSVIDTAARKRVSTVGLDTFFAAAGNPAEALVTPDGRTLCVSLSGVHQLCLLDVEALVNDRSNIWTPMMGVWPIYPALGSMPWRRVKLPGLGPRGLAIAGNRVYAAEYFTDTLAVVDLARLAPADETPPYSAVNDRGDDSTAVSSLALGPPPKWTARRRGEQLFHDAFLCAQQWQSCASCHPEGRVDGLNWDLLNDGEGNPKNTKSMLLSHETPPAMAEGVRMSAEEAVRSGIKHVLFSEPKEEDAEAIDEYLKSLRPLPSPHLVGGDLSPAAQRGKELFFGAAGCAVCHPAPEYTDLQSHESDWPDEQGRRPRLDTPTLIEAWRTSPYMHDGRYETIAEALILGRHGLRTPAAKRLTEEQLRDLAAFVLSL